MSSVTFPADGTLSLPLVVAWTRFHLGRIVGGGVLLACLALLGSLASPKTYESATTLLVLPPTFKENRPPDPRDPKAQPSEIAERMPRALPVEAYKALALTPSVLNEVIQKVPLEKTGFQALQKQLEVELVQMGSRGAQGITYTQALIFHAKARDPQLAAKTAQAWAEAFKDQVDHVSAEGVQETFGLLETLHTSAKADLDQADLALAEHKKAWNIDLMSAQLKAKQEQYTKFESELKQAEVELASGEKKLKTLQDEIATEPQKNVFFRAPSDDAYWIAGSKLTPDKGLRTEESNPSYVTLREMVVTAEGDVEQSRAKRDAIQVALDAMKKEIDALTVTLTDKTVERDKLMRDAESFKKSYDMVRGEYEMGRMAEQTKASDIVLAGQAVAPLKPSGAGPSKIVVLAWLVGMLATAGLLILKELSDSVTLPGTGSHAHAEPVAVAVAAEARAAGEQG